MRTLAGGAIGAMLLGSAAFALFGRFGDDDVPPRENAVTLDEWEIAGDLDIPAGTVIEVENTGSIQHNLVLNAVQTPFLQAGESTTLDLSSLEPGRYEAWCSLPEHRNEGMSAILTITSAAAPSD